MDLRDIIDKERERQGLSVNALAHKAGLAQPTVQRFLAGQRKLNHLHVAKLLKALGLEVRKAR